MGNDDFVRVPEWKALVAHWGRSGIYRDAMPDEAADMLINGVRTITIVENSGSTNSGIKPDLAKLIADAHNRDAAPPSAPSGDNVSTPSRYDDDPYRAQCTDNGFLTPSGLEEPSAAAAGKSRELRVDLCEATDENDAIITPLDSWGGVYFTLIGGGDASIEDQNRIAAMIVQAVNHAAASEAPISAEGDRTHEHK